MHRCRLVPFLLLACLPRVAQAPPPTQEPARGLVSRKNVQEVLLDVVVRDKREKMVPDLKPEDLEVYEDGVKQSLRTFRFVFGAEVRAAEDKAAAQTAGTAKINPLRQLNLVLIVFRMLGAQDRLAAKLAA